MRLLLLLLVLAGCKSTVPVEVSAVVPSNGIVRGTVQSVDMSPMAYDGNGLVAIETDSGAELVVDIPARMGLCQAEGLDVGSDLQPGDRIEVRGDIQDGHMQLCTNPEHYLRLLP